MKTTLHSIHFIAFLILFGIKDLSAQCTRTTTFQDGDYVVTGIAQLEYLTNGTKTLSFEGFDTMTGPDVDVYLSNSNNSVAGAVLVSDLNYSSSSQYIVPSNVNINDYQYVVLWCTSFSQWWGYGSLGIATGSDCATLGIEISSISEVKIHPNPVMDIIHISGLKNKADIRIFDVAGKMVFSEKMNVGHSVDVSELNAGLYLISVNDDRQFTTKRLIIQ